MNLEVSSAFNSELKPGTAFDSAIVAHRLISRSKNGLINMKAKKQHAHYSAVSATLLLLFTIRLLRRAASSWATAALPLESSPDAVFVLGLLVARLGVPLPTLCLLSLASTSTTCPSFAILMALNGALLPCTALYIISVVPF